MAHVLRNGMTELEFTTGHQVLHGRRLALPDDASAMALLRPFVHDPINVSAMRALLGADASSGALARVDDREVVARLARALAGGHIGVVRRTADLRPIDRGIGGSPGGGFDGQGADGQADAPAEPVAAAREAVEKTWVTIELVDEEGRPVPGEEYWIRTAANRSITGRLGPDGRARVEGVEAGNCSVTFPNLDVNDWRRA